MMLLYVPMMNLLLYILVASSEGVLKKNQFNISLSLTLKKEIQNTKVQLRKYIATIDPTPFLKYSKKRISVYIVNHRVRKS